MKKKIFAFTLLIFMILSIILSNVLEFKSKNISNEYRGTAIYIPNEDETTSVLSNYTTFEQAKNAGYKYDHAVCTPTAEVTYDDETNSVSMTSKVATKCEFYFDYATYIINGVASGNGAVTASTSIKKGKTTTLTITPSGGSYLSSGSCTNGYTITNMNIGTSYTSAQTVTINNNNQIGDTTCTFTFAVPLITFTIDGTSYQAEEGMTWREWVNSQYNTSGYVIAHLEASWGIKPPNSDDCTLQYIVDCYGMCEEEIISSNYTTKTYRFYPC